MFEVLVLFIFSPSCSSIDLDDTGVLLNFFFNNFDFDDKDVENLLHSMTIYLILHFPDSYHFLDLHRSSPIHAENIC